MLPQLARCASLNPSGHGRSHANFEAAWPRFAERYGEPFHRLWRYYLLSCAGAFRARDLQLWQWVLSRDGVRGGWRRPE